MKKLSTLFLSLLMAAGISSSAGTATFDFTKGADSDITLPTGISWPSTNVAVNGLSFTNGDISVSASKAQGTSNPAIYYNNDAWNYRVYQKNTLTISSSAENITAISIDLKSGTPSGTNGSISADLGKVDFTDGFAWSGDAESVTFTMYANKACNLQINSITVTTKDSAPTYWVKFDTEGQADWAAPQIWAWDADGDFYTTWPGEDMEATEDPNILIKHFDKMPTGIIISHSNGGVKAGGGNINNPVNHATYKSDASAVDEEGNPVGGPKDVTVYFDNRDTKWAVVACYLESSSSWPGAALSTAEGKNHIYQVTFKDTEGFIIFNNNNNGIQTDDIGDYVDGHIYKWAAGTDGKSHEDLGVYDPANFPEGDEPGPGPEPEVDHWYLVGKATGWALDESMELTAVNGSENVFSITLNSLAGEWKIWNGAWSNKGGKEFNPGSETSAASGEAMSVWCNGTNSSNYTFPIKPDTKVTITLTIPEGAGVGGSATPAQLVVVYTSAEETLLIPEKLGVLSTPWFTGNNAVTEMAYDEATNTFSIDNYEVGEDVPAANALADEPATQKDGYVQFGVNTEATTWAELNTAHRYGAETEGTALEFSGDMAEADIKHFAENPGQCKAFKLAPGKYDLAVKFNPEDKTIKLTAKVTPTGVENVSIDADNEADAEYFNLQGVKVAEPSNGIFIRRANGKTTKVFVK